MFSIVIPLFNKAEYVKKSIESVLKQTYPFFEIIVVDDGSTDGSVSVISKMYNSKIRVIRQFNQGVSIARNNGVSQATSDYIAFLDADDWWEPAFLDEMSHLIECYPDAHLWGCNYYYVKNNRLTVEDKGIPHDFTHGYLNYFEIYSQRFCVPINCSFVIVKKSAFWKAGGFRPSLKMGEDFDLWVRMALQGKIAYLNKPLAYSNQDVQPGQRALGEKLWKKEEHFIFNLDYLQQEEDKNPALKTLLDGLKVRSLATFYLKKQYEKDTTALLNMIDIARQPLYYRFLYQAPRQLVILFMQLKKLASFLKQTFIKWLRPT